MNVLRTYLNTFGWGAEYVLVYPECGTPLSAGWERGRFSVIGKVSWEDYKKELRGQPLCPGRAADWWLLRHPRVRSVAKDGSSPTKAAEHGSLHVMAFSDLPTATRVEPRAALVGMAGQRLRGLRW